MSLCVRELRSGHEKGDRDAGSWIVRALGGGESGKTRRTPRGSPGVMKQNKKTPKLALASRRSELGSRESGSER